MLPGLLDMQEVVSLMVRLVWVVNVVLGFLPVGCDHLVQHLALSFVAEHMPTQVLPVFLRFPPKFLGSARSWPYPETTVEAEEPTNDCLTGLPGASPE